MRVPQRPAGPKVGLHGDAARSLKLNWKYDGTDSSDVTNWATGAKFVGMLILLGH